MPPNPLPLFSTTTHRSGFSACSSSPRSEQNETAAPKPACTLRWEYHTWRPAGNPLRAQKIAQSSRWASPAPPITDLHSSPEMLIAAYHFTSQIRPNLWIQTNYEWRDRLVKHGGAEDEDERTSQPGRGRQRGPTERLQARSFRANHCVILVLLSFGYGDEPWVSLTVVPDGGQDPRIDLLSYEFLTDEERERSNRASIRRSASPTPPDPQPHSLGTPHPLPAHPPSNTPPSSPSQRSPGIAPDQNNGPTTRNLCSDRAVTSSGTHESGCRERGGAGLAART